MTERGSIAPVPVQLGTAVQHSWGIYPLGDLSRCSFNTFSWDLEVAFSFSYLFLKHRQKAKKEMCLIKQLFQALK